MDIRGVVPLDEKSLIDTAVANTGLSDFGDDSWREPFQVLVKALDDESELNLVGRLMTRSDLLVMLEARLRVEEYYKRHPEIDDQEIVKPLLIVGQGRSGTTYLQNLLTSDPDNETVATWEAMFPCPPPEAATYLTDPRVDRADRLVTQMNRVAPTIESMHEFNARVPTESIQVQSLAFRSPAWFDSLLGQVPSYAAYMSRQNPADAYRYEKRVLKLLQWRNPRRTWIMKSPFAITHLPRVLEVYPDVGFIWTHRDPVKSLSSMISLMGTLHWIRSDRPFVGEALTQFTNADLSGAMMSQPIRWLEDGSLPAERLCNVQYTQLLQDPLSVVEQIYSAFGIDLSTRARVAMAEHLERDKRSRRPAHQYDLGSDEEIQLERAAFTAYQQYFGVEDEI